jgi:hypothetical protein
LNVYISEKLFFISFFSFTFFLFSLNVYIFEKLFFIFFFFFHFLSFLFTPWPGPGTRPPLRRFPYARETTNGCRKGGTLEMKVCCSTCKIEVSLQMTAAADTTQHQRSHARRPPLPSACASYRIGCRRPWPTSHAPRR